jgi:hypothetical protein
MVAEKRFPFAKWFPVKPRHSDEVPTGLHPALAELCRLRQDRGIPLEEERHCPPPVFPHDRDG